MSTIPEESAEEAEGGRNQLKALIPGSLRSRAVLTHSFEWVSAAGLAGALIVVIVIISLKSPYFLTSRNFVNIARAVTYDGIVAAAMTLVLICGELDLSIGAILALGGIAGAKVLGAGAPASVAILAGLGVGLGAGAINAGLIVRLNVNPLICTIGTQFAIYGVAYIWASGNSISAFGYSGFSFLGNGRLGSIYLCSILLVVIFIVLGLALSKTRYGSQIYAIGGSRVAARRVGIRVDRVRTSVYLLSGVAAALGGLIIVSADGSASPASGTNDALVIISSAIIGGTALAGGRGNLFGTLLGVLFFGVLQNGMDLLGLQSYWQMFVEGVVLILAITLDEQFRRRSQREE